MAAIDGNALSLVDFAKMSSDPRVEGIAWSLVNHNAILADVPWKPTKALKAVGSRWESLPSTNWVKLNESLVTQDGSPVQHWETLFAMRDLIKTDQAIRGEANQIEDPHAARINAYLESRSREFNRVFINNDPANGGDIDALVGLRGRLDNPDTYKVNSGNKITSGGTFTTAATQDNYLGVLAKMDDLLDAVNDLEGSTTVIYCNREFLKRFSYLARKHSGVGGFGRADDQYDRSTYVYKGAILRDVGYGSDQTTPIISPLEPADGGYGSASTYTSLYAVNYKEFGGLMNSMRVVDNPPEQGFLDSTMIELVCGLFPRTNRCFSRLCGINLG